MITAHDVLAATDIAASASDPRLAAILDATNAYVARYKGNDDWTADTKLGACMIARGLWRDGYTPAIGEGWEQNANVFARVTDIKVEQLLRIGRFSPPRIG